MLPDLLRPSSERHSAVRKRAQAVAARRLSSLGTSDSHVARVLCLPRETVRDWRRGGWRRTDATAGQDPTCPVCIGPYRRNVSRVSGGDFDAAAYAYLLGLYLGDGWLSRHRGSVYKLRIRPRRARQRERPSRATVRRAPSLLRVSRAIGVASAGKATVRRAWGALEALALSCCSPRQARRAGGNEDVGGAGVRLLAALARVCDRARTPRAALARADPGRRLSGGYVTGSDGRAYPRYFFSNRSSDILAIFCRACDHLGLAWTRPSAKHVSIARRPDVARLDDLVGPKS